MNIKFSYNNKQINYIKLRDKILVKFSISNQYTDPELRSLLHPPSRDFSRRHPAVRDSKDGVDRDTAASPPHLHGGSGRFSRPAERVEHGELRGTGAADSVDE